MAYIKAVQNGNYSSPSTWEGGIIPGTGDYACTLTYRIVLDIDVSASLCVNQTDWVAAGGTTTASFQGGFDVPDGATRVISGDLRYDNSSSLTTDSLTTSALTLRSGHLTLDRAVYVPGYLATTSFEKYVIYFSPTSASNASLTIITSVDVSRGSTGLNSGYYGTTIIVIGVESGMVTLNIPKFNMLSGTSASYMSSVLYMTGSTGYTLNMNGNFFNGAYQTKTSIIYINTTSTGIDNQIININTASIGAGALTPGYGINVQSLSTINFMQNTTINCPSASTFTNLFSLNRVRNSVNIPGTLTSSGYGVLNIALSGGTINCGNIVQAANGNNLLIVSGSGNTIIGDITTSGGSYLVDTSYVVSIESIGTITVGNIYFPVGALHHKNILAITSSRTSQTVIGSIDCTNQYTRTGSPVVLISGGNTSSTIVNGNIIGSLYGSTTDLDAAALYVSTPAVNQGQFTINGNVKAGIRGPGLQMVAGSQQNITINGTVIGADYPSGATIIPAAVQSRGRRVLIRNIDTGIDGKHPIDGLFAFIDPETAYYKGIDSTGAILTLNAQVNAVPPASDVRFGVSTGVTTGTLVVPQASTVLNGVVFDNGTTGTLSIGGGGTVDLSPVQTVVDAIKTKTDQLTFDTVSVTEYLGGDPSWDSVSLLLHGNGTNGSTTIVDEAGRIGTVFGNTQISTTQSKYGGASIKFDGTGDYISYNGTGLVDFGTSDFTIEFWIFPSVTTNGMLILDARPSGSQNAQVTVAMDYNGTGKINWYTSSAFKINSASSISTGVWSHIAFSRASGKLRLFINGVLDSSVADNTTYVSNTNVFVGANSYSPGSDSFNGYLDDLRVTHGVARYIDSFTPPAAELPGGGTSITYDQSQVVASGTSGGGTCDLTTVNNTLSIINGNVVSNGTNINAIKAKTDQITFTASGVVADAGTTSGSGTVDLSPITSAISAVDGKVTSIKTKTDELSFSSGKVIADASAVDYTSQLSAITSTVNAISDAVDLIDAVTSKIAFETVYSEGDPNLAQVIFKAEFNGTNGSTTINADTGQIGTNQGSPSLNTAYTRTGTSSVALSGSIVSYGDISSLNLGANDFTIEFSVNFSSIVSTAGDYAGVVGKRASNGDFSWICYVTEGKMNFLTSGTNAVSIAHPTTLSPATWYDVAISRTGDILKFYVNGVLSQVSCTGMNMTTTTAPFFIGRFSYDISSYHMFGYLDRLRITVGTGRYNSVAPVSPPVSEYPTTLNGIAQSYKVVANCDSGTTIPTDLTDRLTDLRNRINAIHFIVKDE